MTSAQIWVLFQKVSDGLSSEFKRSSFTIEKKESIMELKRPLYTSRFRRWAARNHPIKDLSELTIYLTSVTRRACVWKSWRVLFSIEPRRGCGLDAGGTKAMYCTRQRLAGRSLCLLIDAGEERWVIKQALSSVNPIWCPHNLVIPQSEDMRYLKMLEDYEDMMGQANRAGWSSRQEIKVDDQGRWSSRQQAIKQAGGFMKRKCHMFT